MFGRKKKRSRPTSGEPRDPRWYERNEQSGLAIDTRIAAAFGLLYLGSSAKVAFVETILRDRADGRNGNCVIEESEIEKRSIASISPTVPLTLVDLTGDGPIKMGSSDFGVD